MSDNLINLIESMCNESEQNATETLARIKAAIQNNKKPDFSKIKDGERFVYCGIEFIRLGLEQGGVLCITADVVGRFAFGEYGRNSWCVSSIRKMLYNDFLSKLNPDDLLPYVSDLTANNGDTGYGKCSDKVGILSCGLYRKYRKFVPLYKEGMWTCTPWCCGTPFCVDACSVCIVGQAGILYGVDSSSTCGLAPVCIFRL